MFGDPYLLWLSSSAQRYFTRTPERVVLFVAFARPLEAGVRKSLRSSGIWISSLYDGYSYATAHVPLAGLNERFAVLRAAGVNCISLASPVAGPQWSEPDAAPVFDGGPDTVLGVIDDGCPFAHRDYGTQRDAPFGVRFVWDQGGQGPATAAVNYGRVLLAPELEMLVDAAKSGGVVDEDAVYRRSGLPALHEATSHGAQVLSHATGNARPRRAPTLAGRNDIAFVQLPSAALDDPSGRWLDWYGLDGIHAIRFYARHMFQQPAPQVVINLSYGPQTGPHDGSSMFEKAVDEIIQKAAAESWQLDVVLPAGNSHLARAHGAFDLAAQPPPLAWCVAPDSQVPSYLELWPPVGVTLDDLDVALVSPTGETITAIDGDDARSKDGTATVTAMPFCGKPGQVMVLMVIAATARPRESSSLALPLAVPGRWRVRVAVRAGKAAQGTAHAYLARLDPNLGRKLRGHSGYLYSATYDPLRYLRAGEHLGIEAPAPADVVAAGSLNGIATGSKTTVAAGYVRSGLRSRAGAKPSPYSSGGPSRGTRVGPDHAYPTDDSPALAGRLAGANRSAGVARLVGTSFAAPMHALDLLDPALVRPVPPPPGKPSWFKYRFGKGLREA